MERISCHGSNSMISAPDAEVLAELGAGSGRKTTCLISNLTAPVKTYSPIDISEAAIRENVATYNGDLMSDITISPYVGSWKNVVPELIDVNEAKTFLFLGSSLGNYNDEESVDLFKTVRSAMKNKDRFIVGVDTKPNEKKPKEVIHAAYNDAAGITAAFTLNALTHAARVGGLNINESAFKHEAVYVESKSAIITHVVATENTTISTVEGEEVLSLKQGEKIFMEMR
jgi:L-histidine N-alpha-methyltransferase